MPAAFSYADLYVTVYENPLLCYNIYVKAVVMLLIFSGSPLPKIAVIFLLVMAVAKLLKREAWSRQLAYAYFMDTFYTLS